MADDQVLERLDFLAKALSIPDFVGIRFLSLKWGVSDQYVRGRPWLIPGPSDVPGRLLWRYQKVTQWLAEKTPTEREAAWIRLTPTQKKAFMKAYRR